MVQVCCAANILFDEKPLRDRPIRDATVKGEQLLRCVDPANSRRVNVSADRLQRLPTGGAVYGALARKRSAQDNDFKSCLCKSLDHFTPAKRLRIGERWKMRAYTQDAKRVSAHGASIVERGREGDFG
jgi:hypothetical protein